MLQLFKCVNDIASRFHRSITHFQIQKTKTFFVMLNLLLHTRTRSMLKHMTIFNKKKEKKIHPDY